MAAGKADRGVLVCGTGIGMAIAANKVPGVRAAALRDLYTARMSREHNDANVLALGGRLTGRDAAARDPRDLARHRLRRGTATRRRVGKIAELEQRLARSGEAA